MQVVPYLNFNGNCKEAIEFYAEVLGGKILGMMSFGDMPAGEEGCGPELADHIMHACLEIDGEKLMASDCPQEMFLPAQGISVSLHPNTAEDADRIFAALSEGAKSVAMPIQETFWAERFAMFTDRFGTPWMINYAKPCPEAA